MAAMGRIFLNRLSGLSLLLGLATTPFIARADEPTKAPDPMAELFKQLNTRKGEFAKFVYLTSPEVQGDPNKRQIAAQMLATSYSFLGRPNDALRAFPSSDRAFDLDSLPDKNRVHAMPAADWVESQADRYPIVMVNEAHHSPQTRLLTLNLLPKLHAKGFRYLAIETLAGQDARHFAYPTKDTGYYTQEPVFAEMIRIASKLGYELVPYEPETPANHEQTQQERETGMAQNVINRVLAKDPKAKVLVHAGYAHIGEKPGSAARQANPMAMELARLSKLPILSVDQTSLASYLISKSETPNDRLNTMFEVGVPSVLLDNRTQQAWSYKPGQYDVTVLLPKLSAGLRPDWLRLDGLRRPVAIDASSCRGNYPCLIGAHHQSEPDDAVPADQFVTLNQTESNNPLFLAPGDYRVFTVASDGRKLHEYPLAVADKEPHETAPP